MRQRCATAFAWVQRNWTALSALVCLVAPSPFLILAIAASPGAAQRLYFGWFVLVFMSSMWAFAPISIYVTALFPLVLLPVLRLATADQVAALYWSDAITLFLGSFVMSLACERVNLHRRIALKIVLLMGNRPKLILLGVMGTTAFLSMWMSNTATAALMTPLVLPIVQQLEGGAAGGAAGVPLDGSGALTSRDEEDDSASLEAPGDQLIASQDDGARKGAASSRAAAGNYSRSLLIAVAYSASMGGVATLVGTGPNIAFVKIITTLFPKYGGVSFGAWMLFALPMVMCCLAFLWAFFVFVWNRGSMHLVSFPSEVYGEELDRMGNLSFEEKVVLADFVVMALLWLTRSGIPPYVPGWGMLFDEYVQDGTVAIALSVLLFIIPAKSRDGTILLVKDIKELHWDVILLLGSGFAVAEALQLSGVTVAVANALTGLRHIPAGVIVLIVTCVAAAWTEVSSNVATANILLPVVGAVAVSINQNPLLLMIPTTIGCSFAFMLPIATPPNAIVFSSGFLRGQDLIRAGIVMNLFCLAFVTGWTLLLGPLIWSVHFGELPSWAV